MMISGHKTNAMLGRYDIIPTSDIKESGHQADTWWKKQRQKRTKSLKIVRKGKVAQAHLPSRILAAGYGEFEPPPAAFFCLQRALTSILGTQTVPSGLESPQAVGSVPERHKV